MNEPQGYFAVCDATNLEWQGFFLPIGNAAFERDALALRTRIERLAASGSGAEVERGTPGMTTEQSSRLGLASAALMEVYWLRDPGSVGAAALVVHQLSGHRFFILNGQVDEARGGLRTTIDVLNGVTGPDDARQAVKQHPRVLNIEFRRALLGLKHGEARKT